MLPVRSSRSDEDHHHPSAEVYPSVLSKEFKERYFKIDKFRGKDGNDDFKVWVEDYKEATADCGWTDKQRVGWFLSGPADTVRQQSLKNTDEASWDRIVKIYCGQY